jgi:hypothetical protein
MLHHIARSPLSQGLRRENPGRKSEHDTQLAAIYAALKICRMKKPKTCLPAGREKQGRKRKDWV